MTTATARSITIPRNRPGPVSASTTTWGAIQAIQETEVVRDESGDIEPEPECVAVPHAEALLATIPIPGR